MSVIDIREAKIVDGIPTCVCGSSLASNKDYNLVVYKNKQYYMFEKHCSAKRCYIISNYCVDITIDSREVFVFPYKKCKKVKEEIMKIKESDC